MVQRLMQLFVQLVQSYLFLIVIALGGGLLLSDQAILLAPFATLFLQIIFFLTSLKLDSKKVFKAVKNYKMLLVANIFMLLVLPTVVYLIANLIVPEFALALLLLSAMPTGMTAPLLVEVVGGKPSVALVLTLTTSLLAPLTIPLVVGTFAGTAVTVGALTMFWSLVKVIVIPFVLAQGVRYIANGKLDKVTVYFKPASLVLLCLLIMGVVAKQADTIMSGIGNTLLIQLAVLFVFVAVLLVVGYFVTFWKRCDERITVSICMTFMNFTLAIYLAGSFFSDPNILLATVLIIFPWTLLLFPFRYIARNLVCKMIVK
ncbi:hypothetical protein HOI83_00260 [Candidatus Uhrbacteria bacterium]|jgi:bile acid:Na+ symporter, BASS family|nr:hypothetical protein [Candidatus Uhrbacteria bacterium]